MRLRRQKSFAAGQIPQVVLGFDLGVAELSTLLLRDNDQVGGQFLRALILLLKRAMQIDVTTLHPSLGVFRRNLA
jgi:hypothetical protein